AALLVERGAADGARSLDSAACTARTVTGCHHPAAARREFATVEYARSPALPPDLAPPPVLGPGYAAAGGKSPRPVRITICGWGTPAMAPALPARGAGAIVLQD